MIVHAFSGLHVTHDGLHSVLYGEQVLEQGETPGVRFGLALARMRLGEEDAALVNLERVVELDARHVEAHIWLGQLHFDAGRVADARAAAAVEAAAVEAVEGAEGACPSPAEPSTRPRSTTCVKRGVHRGGMKV